MKKIVVFLLLALLYTGTAHGQVTPAPPPYTVNITSSGLPDSAKVKYWGGLSGTGNTPFSISSDTFYTANIEPFSVDLATGYDTGYFLWIWDRLYNSVTADARLPVESIVFGDYTPNTYDRNYKYVGYSDSFVLPTPVPTPMETPEPPIYSDFQVIDAVTKQQVQASNFRIVFNNYYTFTKIYEYTTSAGRFGPVGAWPGTYVVVVSADGYQTMTDTWKLATTAAFELYPSSQASPTPEHETVSTMTPGPVSTPSAADLNWYKVAGPIAPQITQVHVNNRSSVDVTYSSDHTAIRALDWGSVTRNGNVFSVNVKLIDWAGPSANWQTTVRHTYDLGALTQGTEYTFVLSEWGTEAARASVVPDYSVIPVPPPAPWTRYADPTFESEVVFSSAYGLVLTANLFENSTTSHMLNNWGTPVLDGSTITVSPYIWRNEQASTHEANYRKWSYTYDLSGFPNAIYTLNVVIGGTVVHSQMVNMPTFPTPPPTLPPFPDPTPLAKPYVRLTSGVVTLYPPASSSTITLVNFGSQCTYEAHAWLTDAMISVSPQSGTLAAGESVTLTVSGNRAALPDGASASTRNAILVTDGSGYREYLPYDIAFMPGQTGGLLGDVNGDAQVTIVDALLVAQYYVGLNPANFNSANADVTKNGTIDIVDALRIAQYYVGLITSF